MRKAGLTISSIGHAGLLAWGLVTFAIKPFDSKPTDSMPIDLVSVTDFDKMRAGAQKPKAETPKPIAEKVDTPKPVEDPERKVEKKPEVVATAAPAPPPKPEPKPEPKEEKVEKKTDPIAEALKKEEQKKVEPKPEKKPEPKKEVQKKPPQPQQKFDATKIQALLDKREARREMASADTINSTAALGTVRGTAEKLSLSELEALRRRLMSLWNPPAGARNPEQLIVQIRMKLNRDGTLNGPPMVLTSSRDPLYMAARDSAIRAIFRGQPYTMLPPEKYDVWKDVEVTFDPREMFPG